MSTARILLLLVVKDLRIEGRTRSTSAMVLMLGLLTTAVLSLSLGPGRIADGTGAVGVVWVAFLFGGVLFFERAMDIDRDGQTIAALLLAPIDRGVLFASKLLVNLLLLIGLALVVTPAAVVFFHLNLSPAPIVFARIMLISLVGYAAVGTLLSAAAAGTRLPGGLLALLALPLSAPLILASTQQTLAVFGGQPPSALADAVMTAFAVVFVVAGWLLFECLLEP